MADDLVVNREIPDKAIDDLQDMYDCNLDCHGGYPAVICARSVPGYIVIGEADENGEPNVHILPAGEFLKIWRRAKRAVRRGTYESMTEALFEIGLYDAAI
jgi:hypothetical protein